jgi:hypothetical protein
MKVRYKSGAPSVEFTGLGTIKSNEWVQVSDDAVSAFKKAHGKTLEQAGFEVEAKKKKEDS